MPVSEHPPIHKVGIIVLMRSGATEEWRVLLVRPKAKNLGEATPFVPPRGSRQYRDDNGVWNDARSGEDAVRHAHKEWEGYAATATRELEEEAGIPASLVEEHGLIEHGARDYHALHKPADARDVAYPIYWFRLEVTPEDGVKLHPPEDAAEVGWFTLKQMEEEAARGAARPGYVAVVKEAMERAAAARRASNQ